jgi:Peptidase family M48
MAGLKGAFYDGGSARRHDVEVTLSPLGVQFGTEAFGRRLWRIEHLYLPVRLPGGGVRLTSTEAPAAQLVVEAPGFRDELVRLMPRLGSRREHWRRHRLEIAVVVASVLLIVGFFVAVPYLSRPLARIAPERWVDKLGDMAEQQMVGHRRLCASTDGDAALRAMLAGFRLADSYDGPVSVKVVDWRIVNAFAAPGGRVFLTRGALGKAGSPDEVAGVLAHELGHVIEHHPTANAIRQVGTMGLLNLVLGDGGAAMDALGQGGALLMLRSYTRKDEAAADRIALRLLQRAGIDSQGFADFFARLERQAASKGRAGKLAGLDLLSTHPDTAERQALARESAGQGRRPALTPEQWQALKRICATAPAKDGTAD